MSDDEMKKVGAHGFLNRLTEPQKARWLVLAGLPEMESAKIHAVKHGMNATAAQIDAAIGRKLSEAVIERLERLEKPHWTTTPVFWVTLGGAIAAGLAAYFGWLTIQP